MKRNTKALLWVVAVFAVMAVGLYIGGCGSDETTTDAGTTVTNPCDGKKSGDACTGGFCIDKVGGGLECAKECTTIGTDSACGTGEGCYMIGANKVCVTAGTKKTGDACGVANDCEAGNTCLQPEGGSLTCYLVCKKDADCGGGTCTDTGLGFSVCVPEANPCDGKKAGDPCTGGFCVDKVGGGLECDKECTNIGKDSACGTGEGCYLVGANKVCMTAGTRKTGDACGVANDCEAGNMCLEPEGGSMACYLVCTKDADCGGGTCTDTGLGFSVCVAQ